MGLSEDSLQKDFAMIKFQINIWKALDIFKFSSQWVFFAPLSQCGTNVVHGHR